MNHGYTNSTSRTALGVRKVYAGPDAPQRQRTEEHALRTLAGRIPVPQVLSSTPGSLTTSYVDGIHGQDLLDGSPAEVLAACGRLLASVHAVPVGDVFDGASDAVVVHGDFGPNNVLLADGEVVALLDWEWCRPGPALIDLAWCEWIVRTHHPSRLPALDTFYTAYGSRPPLQDLRAARCTELLDFVQRWDPTGPAVHLWQDRLTAVHHWT